MYTYFRIQILTCKDTENGEIDKLDDIHGKSLIYNEHELLISLKNEEGVIRSHGIIEVANNLHVN